MRCEVSVSATRRDGRDDAGRILTIASSEPGESWTYSYDDIDQLVFADNQGDNTLDQTFSYDSVGNMISNSALGAYVTHHPPGRLALPRGIEPLFPP